MGGEQAESGPIHELQKAIMQEDPTERAKEDLRRDAVFGLSLNLLRQLNPGNERIKKLFFDGGDPLSAEYNANLDLRGGRDAWQIAKFYMAEENRDLIIPSQVILVRDSTQANKERIPDAKALMYIAAERHAPDQRQILHFRRNNTIQFSDSATTGFMNKTHTTLQLSDVYVGGIDTHNPENISLSGVDNLILGGSIQTHDSNFTVDAGGRCAIYGEINARGNYKGIFRLHVGGDIHQWQGDVAAMEIKADNYVQSGGSIDRSRYAPEGSALRITLDGKYTYKGGKEPDRSRVDIDDRDYERRGTEGAQTFMAEKGIKDTIDTDTVKLETTVATYKKEETLKNIPEGLPEAEELSERELGDRFDTYRPEKRIISRKADGSRTEIRTYVFEPNAVAVDHYVTIITDGIAAGWTEANHATLRNNPTGTTEILVLQKDIPPALSQE